jgi:CIC family chloride channel protein
MKDVANSDIIFTTPSEDLNEVLKKCTIRNLQRMPVVRDDDHTALIGMLDRREIIEFYNQRVQEIKGGGEIEAKAPDSDVSLLGALSVKDAMNPTPEAVSVDMRLDQVRELIYETGLNSFLVVNAAGKLEGILSLSDCRTAFKKGDNSQTAGDIATTNVISVTGYDSLLSALAKITAGDFAILPVVERHNSDKLAGVISRGDIISAFNNVIMKRESG